jgi:hypothetical protein
LKCSKCKDTVMFWDDRQNQWQSPKSPEPNRTKKSKKSKTSPT